MRTFAQNPKVAKQSVSTTTPTHDQAHLGLTRIGHQAMQRLLEGEPGNGSADLTTTGICRFGHDFSGIPVHSGHPINSPMRREVEQVSDIGKRVRASGVVSGKTSLRPHEASPAALRREAAIYSQGKTPVCVGTKMEAWDVKPLGAPETGAHLGEIHRRFGSRGVEQSMRGLAQ